MSKISENTAVVIPAFNEEESIKGVVMGARKYASKVIVVDDGSNDDTGKIARKAGAIVVSNEKNTGYEPSIEKGFRLAIENGCAIVITMDADGQHLPENIPKFAEIISSGKADLVVGIRDRKQRFAEKLFALYFKRFGILDPLCGFKAYNAKVFEEHGFFDKLRAIGTELVLASVFNGKKIYQAPIRTRKRADRPRIAWGLKGNIKFLCALCRLISHYGFGRKKKN